jgi:hypothetical protein
MHQNESSFLLSLSLLMGKLCCCTIINLGLSGHNVTNDWLLAQSFNTCVLPLKDERSL